MCVFHRPLRDEMHHVSTNEDCRVCTYTYTYTYIHTYMRDIIILKERLTAQEDWLHVASFSFGFVIEQLLCLCTDTVPVLVHYKNTYDTYKQNTYSQSR